jgi:hypothetical protein
MGEITNKQDELYSLEHSQYSESKGLFPYHICPLADAIQRNLQDCIYNNRGENKWQIVFIGTFEKCQLTMNEIIKTKSGVK